jgi:proteasome activator subunit 4
MAQDGMPTAPSYAPTPFTPFTPGNMTPMTPGTPQPGSGGNLGDYLSHRLSTKGMPRIKTYLAGSKALDSLVKLIASTEGFFHPTNSGAWTADVRFARVTAYNKVTNHIILVKRFRQIHCVRV